MKEFKGCFYYRSAPTLLCVDGNLETEYLTGQFKSKKQATDFFKSIAKERGWRFVGLE